MANLVIMESPAKANTVKNYLGPNYKVIACKGHIRDLPKSSLGIDIENHFAPHYINIRGKGDIIKELKKEAKSAGKIFLATDPDREGEAIAWHLATTLGISEDRPCRVTFNEITKDVVKDAMKNPRAIDRDLVNSQQARRILDRLVGFNLSQVLWKNIKGGLSGGRVQSVATRVIADREEEIRAFVPQEYWTVDAVLSGEGAKSIQVHFVGDKKGKIRLSNEEEAGKVTDACAGGEYRVVSVRRSEKQKIPAPPFTTSTMLQEASKKLGFQAQKIMKVAQELYDGLNLGPENGGVQGLITYMRTDSQRVSPIASESARAFIAEQYGDNYIPDQSRTYKSSAQAQDAHEAIRPSSVRLLPKNVRKYLTSDQFRLYKLIWERFIASQMQSAVLDTASVDIENSGYLFRTSGYVVKFPGFLAIYDTGDEELAEENNFDKLPEVREGERLFADSIEKQQHFTEPPPRYTEAALIDFFKENGIGRPSTYAPIISIIIARNYVRREGKSLAATELGELTTHFMREYFPEIVDYEFTADMEKDLDSIAGKENTVEGVLEGFYQRFEKELAVAAKAGAQTKVAPPVEKSDVTCPKCGATMVYKNGRYGRFLACPNYPSCRSTLALDKDGKPLVPVAAELPLAGFKCEVCGADMVIRNGKFGEFYACKNYPECSNTKQKTVEIGVPCPICGAPIVEKRGRGKNVFYSCERYPDCSFSSWDKPLAEKCPDCGEMLFYRKSRMSILCRNPECSYRRDAEPEADAGREGAGE